MTVHDYALICPDYLMECSEKDWFGFVKNKCFKNSYVKSLVAILRFSFHQYLDIYDKNIDRYISPSRFTKNILVKNGLAENKITVLPHFHPEDMPEEKKPARSQERYVLYAGRISADKGVGELIATFKKMRNVTLILAGKKDENFILGEAENVKYVGFLSHRELLKYIRGALLLVSFSRLPETFGLIALEAAANAKPFVGFDSGAYSEIVEDGHDGYICHSAEEMQEKIEKLVVDNGLRILFSRNAAKKAEKFNSQKYYTEIMYEFSENIRRKKRA